MLLFVIISLLFSHLISALIVPRYTTPSKCRFSPLYSRDDILRNSTAFADDIFYWEGHFHQNNVGYNTANGMTYDGTLLNSTTGLASEKHPFSAASKESLQIMVYAHAIAGDSRAARFVSPLAPEDAAEIAAAILYSKLQAYLKFNETYPGFGGYLPWFLSNETDLQPTSDWVNRVPALDNGELIWAVYAAVHVLNCSRRPEFQQLGEAWQLWLDYTKVNAARLFYNGTGRVCAVTDIHNQSLLPDAPGQNYSCEGMETSILDDPYEGELFTWWLYFWGGLSVGDNQAILQIKQPQLVAVNYTGSIVNTSYNDPIATNYSGDPVDSPRIGPITVQKGFWFSSHEQWKVLEMPYFDIPIVKRVFHNAERVRTCNSVLMGQNAGMFASVNNVTDPQSGQIDGYISYAGIPSVANQTEQELDVITPYGVFPTILFNRPVGLAWYKNMLDGKGMQNIYGSTESQRRDGTGISAFVSWDSKVTTVVALLGGVSGFVREKMIRDGIYHEFIQITGNEYRRVFGQGFVGEDVDLCLPNFAVPVANVTDFATCS